MLKGSQKCAIIGEGNVCLDIVDSYLEEDIPMVHGLDIGDCDLGETMVKGDARQLKALDIITAAMIKYECTHRFSSINVDNTTNIVIKHMIIIV